MSNLSGFAFLVVIAVSIDRSAGGTSVCAM
jgi:hypothetical protein